MRIAHHIDSEHKVGFRKGRIELHVAFAFRHFVGECAEQLGSLHPSEAFGIADARPLRGHAHIDVGGQVRKFAVGGRKLIEPVRGLSEKGMRCQEPAENAVVHVHALSLCLRHFHKHTPNVLLMLRQIFSFVEHAFHFLNRGGKRFPTFDDQRE